MHLFSLGPHKHLAMNKTRAYGKPAWIHSFVSCKYAELHQISECHLTWKICKLRMHADYHWTACMEHMNKNWKTIYFYASSPCSVLSLYLFNRKFKKDCETSCTFPLSSSSLDDRLAESLPPPKQLLHWGTPLPQPWPCVDTPGFQCFKIKGILLRSTTATALQLRAPASCWSSRRADLFGSHQCFMRMFYVLILSAYLSAHHDLQVSQPHVSSISHD